MEKLTAVEWLFEQLCSNKFSWINYNEKIYFDKTTSDILNKAKEMEKEQIIEAFNYGNGASDLAYGSEYFENKFKK